jgi:glycerate 2-kinase
MEQPIHIIVAPQAFKGSLEAPDVAAAIAAGIRAGWPWATMPTIEIVPLADGGEGTARALVTAVGGRGSLIPVDVRGPLPGQQITAQLGWIEAPDGPTAVVEMAQAAGLPLVPAEERDPTRTTTAGVGDLIRAALDRGARRIMVGLGGSATNDGGAGMAVALGARLLAVDGNEIPPWGGALSLLDHIDLSKLDTRLAQVEVVGLTDVTNPLCGPEGASAVYGPQKGATPEQVKQLDAALTHYARIVTNTVGRDVATVAGAGAAGGLGAGILAFCGPHARLERGAPRVLAAVEMPERLAQTQLVITGEGRLDGQIAYGKITGELAQLARRQQIPVICVAGGLDEGYTAAYDLGVSAIVVASDGPRTLAETIEHAESLITGVVARALRLWQALPANR